MHTPQNKALAYLENHNVMTLATTGPKNLGCPEKAAGSGKSETTARKEKKSLAPHPGSCHTRYRLAGSGECCPT